MSTAGLKQLSPILRSLSRIFGRDKLSSSNDDTLHGEIVDLNVNADQEQESLFQLPEAPVFRPTMSEFEDPMRFIASIKDSVEDFGICRIVPPSGWDYRCMEKNMNFNEFLFETKCQKVHQLQNRKGHCVAFVDALKNFWNEIQNQPIKCQPMIDMRPLDLYQLFIQVEKKGGYVQVCKEKLWKEVCVELRISPCYKNATGVLQKNYQQIILPYVEYLALNPEVKDQLAFASDISLSPKKIQYNTRASQKLSNKLETSARRKRSTRQNSLETKSDKLVNKKIKTEEKDDEIHRHNWRNIKLRSFIPSDDKIKCSYCMQDKKGKLLNCVKCNYNNAHILCVPTKKLRGNAWICDACLLEEEDGIDEWSYGYDEGKCYTLNEYERMAQRFSASWFQTWDRSPSIIDIENEYWNIIESGERTVNVHYGSDLDVQEHESGFPFNISMKTPETARWKNTIKGKKKAKWVDKNYDIMKTIGWNLNNLPYVSTLRYLNQSIAGVTRPMMYIGMLFSSFCWHTEDNWLYSINYVHKGASKLWYGIPGSHAEIFENAMKEEFPSQFKIEPNLLHLLVTMLSPCKLRDYNIPVCTTIQNEGEFIITFPRAYHAGFNTGFNVAESVNFAYYDWLEWGSLASQSYRFNRSSVFPYEEVLLNIAQDCVNITDKDLLDCALIEAKKIVKDSVKFFDLCESSGVTSRKKNQQVNSDCEQCEACGYDCYLFGVKCECTKSRTYCLQHYDYQCTCKSPRKYIIYRKPLKEFLDLVQLLEERTSSFE